MRQQFFVLSRHANRVDDWTCDFIFRGFHHCRHVNLLCGPHKGLTLSGSALVSFEASHKWDFWCFLDLVMDSKVQRPNKTCVRWMVKHEQAGLIEVDCGSFPLILHPNIHWTWFLCVLTGVRMLPGWSEQCFTCSCMYLRKCHKLPFTDAPSSVFLSCYVGTRRHIG